MKKYVCWDQSSVLSVMDTEAEYIPDHVFAAVHHPVVMKKSAGKTDVAYSQEELLKDFTNNQNNHLFVPVLGVSGSGKSHLIRWLKTHIPSISGEQEVILIPKAGTNLKDILGMILRNREGAKFDEYRKRLRQSVQQIDAVAGRSLLLDKLAHQISFLPLSFFLEKMPASTDKELVDYVKVSLPNLLHDPHFRQQYWLKEGGVIARLYDLAVGTANKRERLEDPRQFTQEDLPLNIEDITKAGILAQEFMSYLIPDEDLQEISIGLLNYSLNEAIRDLLIGGENLTQLMLDVRRQLFQEGVTLILLIEDFAKTQGIDGALLDALIQRSRPEDPLCIMRTAMACTDGYYENIPDTVKTRATFTVKITYQNEETVDYNAFVSLYLNAARLGTENLETNFHKFQQNNRNNQEWKAPNACLSCDFQPSCHAAFGSYKGIGLYPFNSHAAKGMSARVNSGAFNPRLFIGRVLKEVMYRFAPEIGEGNFPNKALLDNFGGRVSRLSTSEMNSIISKIGDSKANQLFPLVEFWSDSQKDVSTGVYEAFDLPPISSYRASNAVSDVIPIPTIQAPSKKDRSPTPEVLSVPEYPEEYYQLEQWRNGVQVNQRTQREVRKILYDAIINYINWDDLGLIKSEFTGAGASNLFKNEKIIFLSQGEVNNPSNKVQLMLPFLEEERITSTMALQGLVLSQHFGSWDFDVDKSYFLAFAKHLKQWSEEIVEQVTTFSEEDKEWTPLIGIIQWMYFSARISGNLRKEDTSLVDMWEKINETISFKDVEYRDATWRRVCERIERHKEEMFNQLYAHALCPKGQSRQLKYFDLNKVLPLLQKIHRNGIPSYLAPRDIVKRYEFLHVFEQQFKTHFEQALKNEIARYDKWKNELHEALGEPEEVGANLNELKTAFQDIEAHGRGYLLGNGYEDVAKFLIRPPLKILDQAYRNTVHTTNLMQDLEANFSELVSRIGRSDVLKVMNETKGFIQQTSSLLEKVQQSLLKENETMKVANAGSLEQAKTEIQASLITLNNLSKELYNISKN